MKLNDKEMKDENTNNQKKPFLSPKVLKINVNETKGKFFIQMLEFGTEDGPS